ncbi:putative methyltransferase domain-containing protein [Trichoderma novae-zelandiae]
MAAKKKTLTRLSQGRPPLATPSRSMTRKASRTLINKHHQLEKTRARAIQRGDKETEAKVAAELEKLGGLGHYQKASLQGQSIDRGGDTSKVLMEWLPLDELKGRSQPLRMLEVGALSTRNACSTSKIFDVEHIDLNSQEPGIQQQDFMERPLPENGKGLFDIISLSLVLNFVPDALGRGAMLLRTLSFLTADVDTAVTTEPLFPCLFVVLPRSCVDNSRYFTDDKFDELMAALGYTRVRSKKTQKLAYSLWRRVTGGVRTDLTFSKQEVNPGRTRNNFVITLKGQQT